MTVKGQWIYASGRALIARVRQELDAHTVALAVGLLCLSYGAWLVYKPAGFIVFGLTVTWWTLPARPPFVARPPQRKGHD